MNQESFDGTEASLLMMTIAYNFMSLFKQLIIGDKVKQRLSTIRYKILAIPSFVVQTGNMTIVKMAIQMNRRAWIRKLWNNTENVNFSSS